MRDIIAIFKKAFFSPMIAPASTLVLFNKNIANFTHKRWENQCSKSFGFCDRTFS